MGICTFIGAHICSWHTLSNFSSSVVRASTYIWAGGDWKVWCCLCVSKRITQNSPDFSLFLKISFYDLYLYNYVPNGILIDWNQLRKSIFKVHLSCCHSEVTPGCQSVSHQKHSLNTFGTTDQSEEFMNDLYLIFLKKKSWCVLYFSQDYVYHLMI